MVVIKRYPVQVFVKYNQHAEGLIVVTNCENSFKKVLQSVFGYFSDKFLHFIPHKISKDVFEDLP